MTNLIFQSLPADYQQQIEQISDENLKRIYLNIKFKYLNFYIFSSSNEDGLISLKTFLKCFKFITYEIFDRDTKIENDENMSKDSSISQLVDIVICVEDYCLFIESVNNQIVNEILQLFDPKNRLNSSIKNTTTKEYFPDKLGNKVIQTFLSKFRYSFKDNQFVKITISSIACYLIRRHFYPTHFFKNPNFFKFNENQENYEDNVKRKLTSFFVIQDKNDLKPLSNEISSKETLYCEKNQMKKQFFEFNEDDFISFYDMSYGNSLSKVEFCFHIKFLHLFAVKKIFGSKEDHEKELDFVENHRHRCFLPFCGYIKKSGEIKGIVYEYMSNGSLLSYVNHHGKQIDELFSFLTIFRISEGINYLQQNDLIHRDLNPSNILLDNDLNAYISDFEYIRHSGLKDDESEFTQDIGQASYISPEQTNASIISFPTDIYSFGRIVGLLFDKMIDTRENIKYLFNSCTKNDPNERIKIDEIRNLLINEFQSFYYIDKYFLIEINRGNISIIVQYFYEMLKASNNQSEIDKIKEYIYDFKLASLLPDDNNKSILYNIIFMYEEGKEIPKNYRKVKEYYELLSKLNNSYSYLALGDLYFYGNGVEQNYLIAKKYYELSASLSNSTAFRYLAYLYYTGTGLRQDYLKAKEYYELSAKQNDHKALFNLGVMYNNGQGVKQDFVKARQYFEQSANLNNPTAYQNLAILYLGGKGVEYDPNKAFKYLEMAAEKDCTEAYLNLGDFYFDGLVVTKDWNKALMYYKKAAEKDDPRAYLKLGNLYYLENNLNLAIYYLTKSSEKGNILAINFLSAIYHNLNDFQRSAYYSNLANRSISNFFLDKQSTNFVQFLIGNDNSVSIDHVKNTNPELFNKLQDQAMLGIKYYHQKNYTKAIECFNTSINNNNNSNSSCFLALMYMNGDGVKQDYNKAKELFELSSQQNNHYAFLGLGNLYRYGLGVEKDIDKASFYYRQSAKQNNLSAIFNIGLIYYEKYDFINAKECFERASKQNYSFASMLLGTLYKNGYGVKKDYSKVKKYYEIAIEQNNLNKSFINSDIYNNLGELYESLEKDFSKAKECYEQASDLGNSNALIKLGNLYYFGNGVKQSYEKAKEFYELASKQNNSIAYINLGNLYFNGLGAVKDIPKARFYYTNASKLNDSDAFLNLGQLSYYEKDYSSAKYYFEQAIKLNNPFAYFNLGFLYEKGFGVDQNIMKAKRLYELSSYLKNSYAYLKLAFFYFTGIGVNIDYLKAQEYCEMAAKQKNCIALYYLGLFYSCGDIIEIDYEKAIHYFNECREIVCQKISIYSPTYDLYSCKYFYNPFCYCALNDLGLINLISFCDNEKAIKLIKEAAFNEFPFAQNNLGLLFQYYLNDIGNAEYMYGRSSRNNFAIAEFNLGHLKEINSKIEESIEIFKKASNDLDHCLIFQKVVLFDKRLEISKLFVILLTNLKIFDYYFTRSEYSESRNYFIKSFEILKKNHKHNFVFHKGNGINAFLHLRKLVFNFKLFNLINQPNLKSDQDLFKKLNDLTDIKKFCQHEKQMENVKTFKCEDKKENLNDLNNHINEQDLNKNDVVFDDPVKLLEFVIENPEFLEIFKNEISNVIKLMEKIVYTPPYLILFGRINIEKPKQKTLEGVSNLFYEGFRIDEANNF